MKIAIGTTDVSQLIKRCTWSGDKSQAARKLEFTMVQDDRDELIPVVNIESGNVIYGGNEDGKVIFIGKVYQIERDRKQSEVTIIAYDNAFVINKSKTTRKYSDALPEDIAAEICAEMGISTGDIAKTGEKVTFIANNKTGYQIIMGAYTESHKKNEKHYQCIMQGEKLCVIEKGELCGVILDSTVDLTDSIYKENIEGIVNRVKVVDDSGNGADTIDDEESQQKYGIVIQTVYKQEKDKDAAEEATDLFKEPEREGLVTSCKGDYRAMAGYSLIISDSLFDGQFWIKSDTHTFKGGLHEMKLKLEFENLMEKETVEQEKPDKNSDSKTNKSGRKRKDEKAEDK